MWLRKLINDFCGSNGSKHALMCDVLKGRTDSVFEAWANSGFERSAIEAILRIVQQTQDYPNFFFLPTDTLTSTIDDDSYDFASCELIDALTEELKILGPFDAAKVRGGSMQMLVEYVIDLAKDHLE